jgi:DUF1365 family protein
MRVRSCLYFGRVTHTRLRPRRHRLSYRVFNVLLDLDELPALHRRLRLFSYNHWNVFNFLDRDHGPGDGTPAREWVEGHLARAGISLAGGRICVLCYPRILGFVFNPISVYFCYHGSGSLAAILYEVHNTFSQRHSYLISVGTNQERGVRQRCEKVFYVSPFIAVGGSYRFRVGPPGDRVAIGVTHDDGSGPLLHAAFSGERIGLRDATLVRALVRYPLMTLKVVAGIHWEALKLWRKGVPLVERPAPPAEEVTVVPAGAVRGGVWP